MELRLAEDRDNEAIRAIYNLEVLETSVTFDLVARSVTEQRQWMADHDGVYPVVVATENPQADSNGPGRTDEVVLGFASLSPYRPRPAYSTTVEDSVYVRRDARGKGVGKALLSEVVALAGKHGFHSVIARIVGDHETSIELHRSCGFRLIGTEREIGRKFGRWLDVAVMQLLVAEDDPEA